MAIYLNGSRYSPTSGNAPAPSTSDFSATCGPSVAIGHAVYISGLNTVASADATSESTAPARGFVILKPSSTTCVVRPFGEVSGFSGLVPGTVYFLAKGSPGHISTSPPAVPVSQIDPPVVQQTLGTPKTGSLFEAAVTPNYQLLSAP